LSNEILASNSSSSTNADAAEAADSGDVAGLSSSSLGFIFSSSDIFYFDVFT
jgi:hypothetical protein